MSDVPTWIQSLQALTTPVIGLGVAVVAFRQWRTAHQKVLLDLFDRRIAIFDKVMDMQRLAMTKGDGLRGHEIDGLHSLRGSARFLFGDDITAALKEWHETLIDLTVSTDVLRDKVGSTEEHHPKILHALRKTRPYREFFPKLFSPYMRMDQKRPRSISEIVNDMNKRRLSHSDQP